MNQPAGKPDASSVRQVLEAEEQARERVIEAEREAAETVEAARAEARRIESAAVERARRVQADAARDADERIAALREAAGRELEAIDVEAELPRIRSMVERIARDLIGADPS